MEHLPGAPASSGCLQFLIHETFLIVFFLNLKTPSTVCNVMTVYVLLNVTFAFEYSQEK